MTNVARTSGKRSPVHAVGGRYILGAMAMWRLLWGLPSGGESGSRLRQELTVPALLARAPRLASLVLGVAIAAQAVAIALSLSGELSAGSAVRVAVSAGAHTKHLAALDGITAAHLFGVTPEELKASEARVVSRSPLVLTGTLATGNPHDGFAIVGSSTGTARTIYVGSEAAPGTVLIEVYPKWVVLQRGTERVTLHFPHENLPSGAATPVMAFRGLSEDSAPASEDSDSGGAFVLAAPPSRPHVTDDAAVMRSFGGLLPAKTVDGQDGMQIMGTAITSKALAAMGLHSGDVIVEINGVAVGAPNAPDLIHALQSGNVTLTVERGGEDTSVTLDSSSMADAATAYRQADPDL
jgi:type II secretory pathway component PulC